MLTRIITAVVALAVLAAVLIAPPIVFMLAVGGVILVMLWECYTATKADGAMKITGMVSSVLMMIAVLYRVCPEQLLLCAIAVTIMAHLVLVVFKHGKKTYTEILANAFLTIYITMAMGNLWYTKVHLGIVMMGLIFVCAWSTDTFAYFVGYLFGKHKLIPHVSPKKTIEGAVGGVIGAAIVCSVYMGAFNNSAIVGLIFGFIGSIISQLGDLAASAIKRDGDIKDFGWIFPGHGGFMDRFDSVMLVSLCMFVMFYVFQIVEIF